LEEGTVDDRKAAARELAALGSQEGFRRFLVLPSVDDRHCVGLDFYTALLVEHSDATTPLLLEAVHHDSSVARYRAFAALQRLRPPGATRALVAALGVQDDHGAVLNALAHQQPAPGEAIGALEAAMGSDSDARRLGAAGALGRRNLVAEDLAAAREMLEHATSDPVALVRIHSAWSLAEIGPRPESVPCLVAALSDEVDNVRRAAARALSVLGAAARPARAALERALDDRGSSDVRKYAAEALAKIRAAGEHEEDAARGS